MKILRIAAISIAFALAGCAGPQLQQHQLINLNQGMTPEAGAAVLQLAPLSVHLASVEAIPYQFQHYRLNNGMQSSTYFLAYKDGKLVYWGYVDDFRRHPNQRLAAALDQVLPAALATH